MIPVTTNTSPINLNQQNPIEQTKETGRPEQTNGSNPIQKKEKVGQAGVENSAEAMRQAENAGKQLKQLQQDNVDNGFLSSLSPNKQVKDVQNPINPSSVDTGAGIASLKNLEDQTIPDDMVPVANLLTDFSSYNVQDISGKFATFYSEVLEYRAEQKKDISNIGDNIHKCQEAFVKYCSNLSLADQKEILTKLQDSQLSVIWDKSLILPLDASSDLINAQLMQNAARYLEGVINAHAALESIANLAKGDQLEPKDIGKIVDFGNACLQMDKYCGVKEVGALETQEFAKQLINSFVKENGDEALGQLAKFFNSPAFSQFYSVYTDKITMMEHSYSEIELSLARNLKSLLNSMSGAVSGINSEIEAKINSDNKSGIDFKSSDKIPMTVLDKYDFSSIENGNTLKENIATAANGIISEQQEIFLKEMTDLTKSIFDTALKEPDNYGNNLIALTQFTDKTNSLGTASNFDFLGYSFVNILLQRVINEYTPDQLVSLSQNFNKLLQNPDLEKDSQYGNLVNKFYSVLVRMPLTIGIIAKKDLSSVDSLKLLQAISYSYTDVKMDSKAVVADFSKNYLEKLSTDQLRTFSKNLHTPEIDNFINEISVLNSKTFTTTKDENEDIKKIHHRLVLKNLRTTVSDMLKSRELLVQKENIASVTELNGLSTIEQPKNRILVVLKNIINLILGDHIWRTVERYQYMDKARNFAAENGELLYRLRMEGYSGITLKQTIVTLLTNEWEEDVAQNIADDIVNELDAGATQWIENLSHLSTDDGIISILLYGSYNGFMEAEGIKTKYPFLKTQSYQENLAMREDIALHLYQYKEEMKSFFKNKDYIMLDGKKKFPNQLLNDRFNELLDVYNKIYEARTSGYLVEDPLLSVGDRKPDDFTMSLLHQLQTDISDPDKFFTCLKGLEDNISEDKGDSLRKSLDKTLANLDYSGLKLLRNCLVGNRYKSIKEALQKAGSKINDTPLYENVFDAMEKIIDEALRKADVVDNRDYSSIYSLPNSVQLSITSHIASLSHAEQ